MEKGKILILFSIFSITLILLLGLGILIYFIFSPDLSPNKIAIVKINTPIISDLSSSRYRNIPTSEDYINTLDNLEKDDSIKGVLLIFNSPGGEVVASEKLARKIKELSKKKPVVSYVESLGASGAYMAMAPTYIVAERDSIVGSIGVRMDILQYYNLLKKIGVNMTVIKAGKYKDIGSPTRPMTKEEKEYLQKLINETYDYFVKWVATNRNIPLNKTYEIADGKIYSGLGAYKVGLVDQVGTEKDAKEKLKEMTHFKNVSDIKFIDYSPKKGVLPLPLEKAFYYVGYGIGDALINKNINKETIQL